MAEITLRALAESEKEPFCRAASGAAPQRAQEAIEGLLNRILLRYSQSCEDEDRRAAAPGILTAVSHAASWVCSVKDVHYYHSAEGTQGKGEERPRLSTAAIILLVLGIILIAASWLGQRIASGKLIQPGALLSLALAVAGAIVLWFAGRQSAKNRREEIRTPDQIALFEVDADEIWHTLMKILTAADGALEELSQTEKLLRNGEVSADGSIAGGGFTADEMRLLTSLLETACGRLAEDTNDEDALDMLSQIKYYLHTKGAETVMYSEADRSRFELLPADSGSELSGYGMVKGKTLRPAIVAEGKTLARGLASM